MPLAAIWVGYQAGPSLLAAGALSYPPFSVTFREACGNQVESTNPDIRSLASTESGQPGHADRRPRGSPRAAPGSWGAAVHQRARQGGLPLADFVGCRHGLGGFLGGFWVDCETRPQVASHLPAEPYRRTMAWCMCGRYGKSYRWQGTSVGNGNPDRVADTHYVSGMYRGKPSWGRFERA